MFDLVLEDAGESILGVQNNLLSLEIQCPDTDTLKTAHLLKYLRKGETAFFQLQFLPVNCFDFGIHQDMKLRGILSVLSMSRSPAPACDMLMTRHGIPSP